MVLTIPWRRWDFLYIKDLILIFLIMGKKENQEGVMVHVVLK